MSDREIHKRPKKKPLNGLKMLLFFQEKLFFVSLITIQKGREKLSAFSVFLKMSTLIFIAMMCTRLTINVDN
ncbi:MAG: hypothetical protein ACLFT0_10390 [Spirulinaceae cyanobacterium]